MRREHLPLVFLILAVLACNLPPGIPVTPTIVPTLIPTTPPTPTAVVLLPSDTPTATFTPSDTATVTETQLPSNTPVSSPTDTPIPSATLTLTPSDTATSTPIPTETFTPTLTDTLLPTSTSAPTETLTPLPTDTAIPTTAPTVIPSATASPVVTDTPSATLTLVPSPTLVDLGLTTATIPPTPRSFIASLVPSPTSGITASPLPPPTATFSGGPVVIAPSGGEGTSIAELPTPTAVILGGRAETAIIPLQVQTNVISARNADRNKQGILAAVDASGHLSIGGNPVMPNIARKESQITLVRWSPDGRWLAFVAQVPNAPGDPSNSLRTIDDGLWVLDTASGETTFVLRQKYDNPYDSPQVRVIDDVLWGPDNDVMLITLRRHNPGQFATVKASIVVGLGAALAQNKTSPKYANVAESLPVIPYLGGSWLDNQRFVAVTSIPGQSAQLGIYRWADNNFTQIADGAALHLWMQNATQLPDGRFAFLGRPAPTGRLEENPQTPLRLYVMTPGGAPIPASGLLPGPVLLADWDATRTVLTAYVQEGSAVVPIALRP